MSVNAINGENVEWEQAEDLFSYTRGLVHSFADKIGKVHNVEENSYRTWNTDAIVQETDRLHKIIVDSNNIVNPLKDKSKDLADGFIERYM